MCCGPDRDDVITNDQAVGEVSGRAAAQANPAAASQLPLIWSRLGGLIWTGSDALFRGAHRAGCQVEVSATTTYLRRHRAAHGRSVVPRLGFGAATRGDRNPLPEAGSQASETGEVSRTTVQAGDIAWPQGRPNPRRHSSESPASPRVALTSWSPSRRKAFDWRRFRCGIVVAESSEGDQAGITSQSGVHETTL